MSGVPSGWIATKLQEVVSLKTGPFGSALHQSDYVDGGIPIINPMHIVDGKICPTSKHRVSIKTAERLSEFKVEPGDVIMSRRGEMGRCAVVRPAQAGWLCGTGSLIVRSEKGISPDFLQRYLSSDMVVEYLLQESVGSTMANLNQEVLLGIEILLPPSAEQVRIVEKLEALLSDLDTGSAELKAAYEKIEQYRQSLLKAAVEGALTADWRAERAQRDAATETGAQLLDRILTERRARWEAKQLARFAEQGKSPPKDWQAKYTVPPMPDPSGLPALPQGWVWATVEQLGEVQLGRQRSPDKLKGLNPTKYIRAANITEQGIDFDDVLEMDFSENERATFELKAGHVLLTEASGSPEHVGRPVIWPAVDGLYCFQNTVIRFIPQGIGSDYAFRVFQACQRLGKFRQLSGGVGINHLSAGKLSGLAVPLPPRPEQEAIVDALARGFASLETQAIAIEHSLKQSRAQRKNILNTALSGQLVSQDPNDEPAKVLLQRIRREREERANQPKPLKVKGKKEAAAMTSKMIDVLAEAGDWVQAQEAFRRCGVVDGAQTDQIEMLYAELRELDKAGQLAVEPVTDAQGRKLSDRLKLVARV